MTAKIALTTELIDALATARGEGLSIVVACKRAGISTGTFYRFRREAEAYLEQRRCLEQMASWGMFEEPTFSKIVATLEEAEREGAELWWPPTPTAPRLRGRLSS